MKPSVLYSKMYLWVISNCNRPKKSFRILIGKVNHLAITLTAVVFCAPLYLPALQSKLIFVKNYDMLFLGMAAFVGGMLTISFSFSLLPVQKAIDSYTQSLSRIYIDDLQTRLFFSVLVIISLILFLFPTAESFGLSYQLIFPIALVLVAFSFDLLRMHNKRISILLTPDYAIDKLKKLAIQYIYKNNKQILSFSKHIKRVNSSLPNQQDLSTEEIQASLFTKTALYYNPILGYINQLNEICLKAIIRNEITVAQQTIDSIGKIVTTYIQTRSNCIQFDTQWEGVAPLSHCDIDELFTTIFTYLDNLAQRAILSQQEGIIQQVQSSLFDINSATLALNLKVIYASLNRSPSYYIKDIAIQAQLRHEYVDPTLTASSTLSKLAIQAISQYDYETIILLFLDHWNEAIKYLHTYKNAFLINRVLDDLLSFTYSLIDRKPNCSPILLKNVLEKIEHNIIIAKSSGILHSQTLGCLPYSAPYDLCNRNSLGHIFTNLYNKLDQKNLGNDDKTDHHFDTITKEIEDHFFRMAYAGDFGNKHLIWYMLSTLRSIFNVFFHYFDRDWAEITFELQTNVKRFHGFLCFPLNAFNNSKNINEVNINEASNLMSHTGMRLLIIHNQRDLFGAELDKCVKTCLNSLSVMTILLMNNRDSSTTNNISGILEKIYYIQLLAERKNIKWVAILVENALQKIKDSVDSEPLVIEIKYSEAIKYVQEQCLNDLPSSCNLNNPEYFLRYCLNKDNEVKAT